MSDSAKTPSPFANSAGKTFIDYFLPMPIIGELRSDVWGAPEVGPRDVQNGLEDATMEKWCYWDGQIMPGADGRFHMFASRWDQATGHENWRDSHAVQAISDNLYGPYLDQGMCWPQSQNGKGHNSVALALPDGRCALVTSEVRPGEVFVADSWAGPWESLGLIEVAENEFSQFGQMSNVSMMIRPDGDFQIVPRSGAILISKNGILGPYVVQGPGVFENLPNLPKNDAANLHFLEDPAIWHSGGWYHMIVNQWNDREASHLTSLDGINNWMYRGLAYDATRDFVRYEDGTVNRWHKLERMSVLMTAGHISAITLAVIDVGKNDSLGNDHHGSKVIVIPFDGAALDRDLAADSGA